MKRLIIFIFTLFGLFVININAQEKKQNNKTDSIIYSKFIIINPFGIDTVLKNVKYGDRIKYKICNVNTFKINASVKTEGIDYDFKEMSGILEKALKTTNNSEKNRDTNAFVGNTNNETETNYIEFIKIAQKIMLRSTLEDILLSQVNDSVFIRDIPAYKEKSRSDYLVCYQEPNDTYSSKKDVQTTFEKFDTLYFAFKKAYDDHINSLNTEFNTKFGKKSEKTQEKEKKILSEKINDFTKTYSYADTLYMRISI